MVTSNFILKIRLFFSDSGPSFGFILDPNGTIESIRGNVEHFFGLTAVILILTISKLHYIF